MTFDNNQNVYVDIPEIKNANFRSLRLKDSVGLNYPTGQLSFDFNSGSSTNSVIDLKEITINIKQLNGVVYNITASIYKRDTDGLIHTLSFICLPYKFIINVDFHTYIGFSELLTLYKGKIDKTIESDTPFDLELYQANETEYSALSNYLFSYKRNSIYSFNWDSLVIRDVKSTNYEYKFPQSNDFLNSSVSLFSNRLLPFEVTALSSGESVSTSLFGNKIKTYGNRYRSLSENSMYNSKWYGPPTISYPIKFIEIPAISCGSIVSIDNGLFIHKHCIVTDREWVLDGKILNSSINIKVYNP